MDTLLLKTFLEVSRTRNFGKAAQNLCVSPSTISARIRQLEEHLGLKLFLRSHHQIGLTPAGERMERHARFIIDAWERAYEDTALSESHQRRLVIAGVASLWDIFLQDWLQKIYQEIPNIGLRAEESTPLRVIEKLDQGLIDVGFMYEVPKLQGVVVNEVMSIPMILVSTSAGICADEAVSEGYVRVEWGTTFATLHESHFPQRTLAPVRVNSGRIALNLLENCGGAAYLPEKVVSAGIKNGHLHPVVDAPVIKMKAYAAYNFHGEHQELISELLANMGQR